MKAKSQQSNKRHSSKRGNINTAKHVPRKRFGQNFLKNESYIQKIVEVIHPVITDHIVEIGPGQGALTAPLLQTAGKLDCIEIDRDLAEILKSKFGNDPKFHIHVSDALKFDLKNLNAPPQSLRVVGNLPYNITTPLLFHLLASNEYIQDMYFMLQKEVVDRLTATPNHKSYGKLTIMVQYFCQTEALFTVPPPAFYPMPKVDSAVIRLKPYVKLPFTASNFPLFESVVSQAFNQRRKMLSTSLKMVLTAQDFNHLEIDASLRPEQLSLETWVKLSNFINSKNKINTKDTE